MGPTIQETIATVAPSGILVVGFHPGYERNGIYPVDAVLPFVGPTRRDYSGDSINMDSDRYHTFSKSLSCVRCGITGVFFAKERSAKWMRGTQSYRAINNSVWHFNLYALKEDGTEVLMTKDHILPKSRGGQNHIDNYQTMCTNCNCNKGNKLEPVTPVTVVRVEATCPAQ